MEDSSPPPALAALALRLVMDYLAAPDVVSCGHVCRLWRGVAQSDDVWRSPRLRVVKLDELTMWQGLRIVKFAPPVVQLESLTNYGHWWDGLFLRALIRSRVQVKKLSLRCAAGYREADWALPVLKRFASCVESLTLLQPAVEHLRAIKKKRAPLLRSLNLQMPTETTPSISVILPNGDKLEDLSIDFYTQGYLEAALRLPALRSLSLRVHCQLTDWTPSKTLPPGHAAGLRTFSIEMEFPDAAWLGALLQAHAATLERVELHCACMSLELEMLDGADYYIPELGRVLGGCQFAVLREIKLIREWYYSSHSWEPCQVQISNIVDSLQLPDTGEVPKVSCNLCECNGSSASDELSEVLSDLDPYDYSDAECFETGAQFYRPGLFDFDYDSD